MCLNSAQASQRNCQTTYNTAHKTRYNTALHMQQFTRVTAIMQHIYPLVL